MRVHSNLASYGQIEDLTNGLPNVWATVSEHRSRTHARSFEIQLEGNGYKRNTGTRGASQDIGATWDEWGVVIGRLYAIDPLAVWGTVKNPIYASAEHFHWATGNRFASVAVIGGAGEHNPLGVQLPADTHKRHSWDWGIVVTGSYHVAECKKCSAVMRRMGYRDGKSIPFYEINSDAWIGV